MHLGLMLGLAHMIPSGGSLTDPEDMTLTGFWRGDSTTEYAPTVWTGTASAGSSGTRDLDSVTAPAAGTTQNGHTPADFDGLTDVLTNATAISTLLTASSYTVWCLFLADAIDTTQSLVSAFANDALAADSGGFWGLHLGGTLSDELQVYHWDGAAKGNVHTVSTGAYNLIVATYDGTNIKSSLNGGTVLSAAAGNISTVTGTLSVGKSGTSLSFFDGRILDLGMKTGSEDDTFLQDTIRSYVNTRYALSL